jgi:hypothetical protein
MGGDNLKLNLPGANRSESLSGRGPAGPDGAAEWASGPYSESGSACAPSLARGPGAGASESEAAGGAGGRAALLS